MRQASELTPEAIASREFSGVGRRGYDKGEVSSFLAEVAGAYRAALEVTEGAQGGPTFEQLGAEAASLLKSANEGAESLRRRAQEEAQQMRREAQEETHELRRKSEEDAAAMIEGATKEAERRVREAELVARRFQNVTKRQCDQMVAEAQARAERLEAHQKDMRQKISDMEDVFRAFRAEMESSISDTLEVDAGDERVVREGREVHDEISIVEGGENEEPAGPKVAGVQPKPIFDNQSVRS
ncbi:hypothetical protein BH24ACT26_BH24ACT26_07020 [soil metagenome]